MQSMSTVQGNLASMAREVEGRNGKSGRGRNGSVDNATEQWDSQAPYVMEQLQAVDESRCNHLRDVLTQYQTHEVDQVERNRLTAEQCLNALLTVETADEIKMFAVRYARDGGAAIPEAIAPRTPASRMAQRNTRMPPRTDTNSSLTVPGAFPQAQDDRASQRSASSGFLNRSSVGFQLISYSTRRREEKGRSAWTQTSRDCTEGQAQQHASRFDFDATFKRPQRGYTIAITRILPVASYSRERLRGVYTNTGGSW